MPKFSGRVLIAEDNQVNQQLIQAILEKFGFEVDVVDNGQKAAMAIAQQQYHLIFMDCQMPVMDGYQATKAIRAMEAENDFRAHIPIIALTAHDLKEDCQKCLAVGMDDYLSKPFSQKQISKILTRWLLPLSAENEAVNPGESWDQENKLPGHNVTLASFQVQSSVLDEMVLHSIRDLQRNDGSSFLCKVIDSYLDESAKHMAQLIESLEHGDAHLAQKAAHILKSSTAQLGASELASLFKEIEQLALSSNLQGVGAILLKITATYAQVREALISERERITG